MSNLQCSVEWDYKLIALKKKEKLKKTFRVLIRELFTQ